jgi:aromatic-L-amino-acid decarboxylase
VSLDPKNTVEWQVLRNRMASAASLGVTSNQQLESNAVWRKPLDAQTWSLDYEGVGLEETLNHLDELLDRTSGNRHPMFFGWVQGGGNLASMYADIIASAANNNCGGRTHDAIMLERELIKWSLWLFDMPFEASGVVTTGTSEAHLVAAKVAWDHFAAFNATAPIRIEPVAIFSSEAHSSVRRAFECVGFRSHLVGLDAGGNMDAESVGAFVNNRSWGAPMVVVQTMGTTNLGKCDDLDMRANIRQSDREDHPERPLWFHLDAALGAHWMCSDQIRYKYRESMKNFDSVAFDFHKGFQVGYDCGAFVTRRADAHLRSFSNNADYLHHYQGGMTQGTEPWPCDLGFSLSRQARAMRAWATIKAYGSKAFGEIAEDQQYLGKNLECAIRDSVNFDLAADGNGGVVCFRLATASNLLGRDEEFAAKVQDSGEAVISTTKIAGVIALRVCITNHRTTTHHIRELCEIMDRTADAMRKEAANA